MRECVCLRCNLKKEHYAKGLCPACYKAVQANNPAYHIPPPESKICSRCKTEKPSSDFPKHKANKDGLDSWCKECNSSRPRNKIVCSDCGELKEQCYKTWCSSCYVRYHRERSIGICKTCNKESKIYLQGNCRSCYEKTVPKDAEKLRERQRVARKKDPEKFRAKDRARRENPIRREYERLRSKIRSVLKADEIREYHRQYRKNNKDKVVRWAEERRSRERNLPYTLTDEQWQQLLVENNFVCYYCGNPPEEGEVLHREHRISQKNLGGYTYENIVPACERCNQRKHDKNEDEFIAIMRARPDEFWYAKWIR